MQIELFSEDSITFKITNNGDDAIELFYNILKKCREEATKKGFRNMFNSDERAFIMEFTDKINGDEA
jgi:hypothetical protein